MSLKKLYDILNFILELVDRYTMKRVEECIMSYHEEEADAKGIELEDYLIKCIRKG